MTLLRNLVIAALAVGGGAVETRADDPVVLERKALSLAAAREIVAASEAEATRRSLAVVISEARIR